MSAWAWLGFILLIGYNSRLLWKAWVYRAFKYGMVVYSLEETPVWFWFIALALSASEIFLAGFLVLVVISAIWGPVFPT